MERALTICDLAQAFAETSGGVKTYLLEKRRHILASTPHRHVLIVPGAADRTTHDGRSTLHEVAAPEVRGYAPYRFILRLDKVRRLLARERPDVVELACPYWLPWAAFGHRRRHPGCAVVGYYHTDYPTAYVGTALRRTPIARAAGTAVRIAEGYVRFVHRRFAATLTGSPALHDSLARIGVGNVHRVPLGVDLDTFHPSRRDRAIWREHGLDPERPVAVFAGRLDGEKRVRGLVEAHRLLAESTGLQLALVGEGPLRDELERRAQEERRLAVLPYQKQPLAVARLLASADLYATAGPHETFGLSVVEAQACGLPVVGVRAGALIERVPPEVGRLAAPDDPASLAAEIAAILGEDLPAIGARARALVEGSFSWRRTFERLLEVYAEVLAAAPCAEGAGRSGAPDGARSSAAVR